MQGHTESTRNTMTRELGITGKLVLGGTVSTGLLLGGFAVAGMTLLGRMNGGALLPTSIGLFVIGALAGLVVSVAAGLVGRADGVTWDEAIRDAGKGVLYAVPACLLGAVVAGWMGMAVIGLYLGSALPIVGSVLAALVAAGVMVATFRVTCASGANALRRVRQVS
ncbi:MAG: hypothetical protein ACOCVZ_09060 [Gemmatimonadota bacterium]